VIYCFAEWNATDTITTVLFLDEVYSDRAMGSAGDSKLMREQLGEPGCDCLHDS
jgi:hypothetical protein